MGRALRLGSQQNTAISLSTDGLSPSDFLCLLFGFMPTMWITETNEPRPPRPSQPVMWWL